MEHALHNVNFQLLLQAHGGNQQRALQAWERICSLGQFGNVPPTYEGGLDVQGLRNLRDDDEERFQVQHQGKQRSEYIPTSPTLSDDIKRIEDLAAGDSPN
jgi:hypothetical protein